MASTTPEAAENEFSSFEEDNSSTASIELGSEDSFPEEEEDDISTASIDADFESEEEEEDDGIEVHPLDSSDQPKRHTIPNTSFYQAPASSLLHGVVQTIVYELEDALTPEHFTKHFRLLDLPVSVRNRIYKQCLVSPQPLFIGPLRAHAFAINAAPDYTTRSGFWNPRVNLLATCKQVYSEATSLFYSLTDFRSGFIKDWVFFLNKVGRSIQHLRQVNLSNCVDNGEGYQETIFKQLEGAKSLQTLTLDASFMKLTPDPARMAAALLPVLQKIHSRREVGKENKAVIDIVTLLPEEIGGEEELAAEVRATAAYTAKMKVRLEKALK